MEGMGWDRLSTRSYSNPRSFTFSPPIPYHLSAITTYHQPTTHSQRETKKKGKEKGGDLRKEEHVKYMNLIITTMRFFRAIWIFVQGRHLNRLRRPNAVAESNSLSLFAKLILRIILAPRPGGWLLRVADLYGLRRRLRRHFHRRIRPRC